MCELRSFRLLGCASRAALAPAKEKRPGASRTIAVNVGSRSMGRSPHQLPARHLVAGAQAWSLRGVPLPRGPDPLSAFRRCYDALRAGRGDRADVEYVRILHLAAGTWEADVTRAIVILLENGTTFDFAAVQALARRIVSDVPDLHIGVPELGMYDDLITMAGAA